MCPQYGDTVPKEVLSSVGSKASLLEVHAWQSLAFCLDLHRGDRWRDLGYEVRDVLHRPNFKKSSVTLKTHVCSLAKPLMAIVGLLHQYDSFEPHLQLIDCIRVFNRLQMRARTWVFLQNIPVDYPFLS